MATGTPPTPTDTAAPLHYAPPPTTCPGLPAWAIRCVLVSVLLHGIALELFEYLFWGPMFYGQLIRGFFTGSEQWLDITLGPGHLARLLPLFVLLAIIFPVRSVIIVAAAVYLAAVIAAEARVVANYPEMSRRGIWDRGYLHASAALLYWPVALFPVILWWLGSRSQRRFLAVVWWCAVLALALGAGWKGWKSLAADETSTVIWGCGALLCVGPIVCWLVIRRVVWGERRYVPVGLAVLYMMIPDSLDAMGVLLEPVDPEKPRRWLVSLYAVGILSWLVLLTALLVARRLDRPSSVSA